MKKMQTVKAELWNVSVCNGVLDYVHNAFSEIKEFYIPSHKISFNVIDDKLSAFRTYENRYKGNEKQHPEKIENVTLPKSFVDKLEKYISLKEDLGKEAIKVISELMK